LIADQTTIFDRKKEHPMSTPEFPTAPNIDALVARFPRLFHGRQPRVWSDLPPGWTELANQLFADLNSMIDDDEAKRFEVVQIKEKFAGLRVYWELAHEQTTVIDVIGSNSVQRIDKGPAKPTALFDRIRARVRQAGEQAATTCQRCGNGGASAGGPGWIVTLCETCRVKADATDAA
jgi:hypothetical protein